MAWVDEACGGFFEKEQAGALKATDVYLFRVAAMLDDFSAHGAVLRRYSRALGKLSLRAGRRSHALPGVATGGGVRRLDGPGVWHGCRRVSRVHWFATAVWPGWTGEVVGAFGSRRWPAIRQRRWSTSCTRYGRFLRFAAAGGLIDRGVLETVPAARSVRQARVPSVWDPADVTEGSRGNRSRQPVWGTTITRSSFLICRLGLRAVDVKRLRFADLDWPANQVSVAQAKTGRRVRPAVAQGCRLGDHRVTFVTAAHKAIARTCSVRHTGSDRPVL